MTWRRPTIALAVGVVLELFRAAGRWVRDSWRAYRELETDAQQLADLEPHKLTTTIKVSPELLADAGADVEAWLNRKLARDTDPFAPRPSSIPWAERRRLELADPDAWERDTTTFCPNCGTRGHLVIEPGLGDYDLGATHHCLACTTAFYLPSSWATTASERPPEALTHEALASMVDLVGGPPRRLVLTRAALEQMATLDLEAEPPPTLCGFPYTVVEGAEPLAFKVPADFGTINFGFGDYAGAELWRDLETEAAESEEE